MSKVPQITLCFYPASSQRDAVRAVRFFWRTVREITPKMLKMPPKSSNAEREQTHIEIAGLILFARWHRQPAGKRHEYLYGRDFDNRFPVLIIRKANGTEFNSTFFDSVENVH